MVSLDLDPGSLKTLVILEPDPGALKAVVPLNPDPGSSKALVPLNPVPGSSKAYWIQLLSNAKNNISSRLQAELKKLRRMYEEQTEKARNEYMTVHSKKVCTRCRLYRVSQLMLRL